MTVQDLSLIKLRNSTGGEVYMTNVTFVYSSSNMVVVLDVGATRNLTDASTNATFAVSPWLSLTSLGVSSTSMFLTLPTGSVLDKSPSLNSNADILLTPENFPTCTCPPNTYISSPCTSLLDASCDACTSCSSLGAYYTFDVCRPSVDTVCKRCTPCNHGFYPVEPCGGSADAECVPCTPCSDMEYETSACSAGVNRICASCKSCVWLNARQEEACESRSKAWRNENCCFDKEGSQVKCGNVDYKNLEIEARKGRHHWVYPDSTPKVEGYELGTWP